MTLMVPTVAEKLAAIDREADNNRVALTAKGMPLGTQWISEAAIFRRHLEAALTELTAARQELARAERFPNIPVGEMSGEDRYRLLAAAVNESHHSCDESCDSLCHSDACMQREREWPAQEIIRLRAKLADDQREREPPRSHYEAVQRQIAALEAAIQSSARAHHGDYVQRAWCQSMAEQLYSRGVRYLSDEVLQTEEWNLPSVVRWRSRPG